MGICFLSTMQVLYKLMIRQLTTWFMSPKFPVFVLCYVTQVIKPKCVFHDSLALLWHCLLLVKPYGNKSEDRILKSSASKNVLILAGGSWKAKRKRQCVLCTCWAFCLGEKKIKSCKGEISLYMHMNRSYCYFSGHDRDSSSSNWDPGVRPFRRQFFCLIFPSPKPWKLYVLSGHQLYKERKWKSVLHSSFFSFSLWCWCVFFTGSTSASSLPPFWSL